MGWVREWKLSLAGVCEVALGLRVLLPFKSYRRPRVFLGVTGKERAALWEMYSGLACAGAVRLVTFAALSCRFRVGEIGRGYGGGCRAGRGSGVFLVSRGRVYPAACVCIESLLLLSARGGSLRGGALFGSDFRAREVGEAEESWFWRKG